MSDEYQLPDELAAVQTRLARLVPAPSHINRDEMMYRAGWVAARNRAPSGRVVRWFPMVSAATAAVIAVAVIAVVALAPLFWPALTSTHRVVSEATNDDSLVLEIEEPPVPLQSKPKRIDQSKRLRTFSGAPLLAMRERALRFEFDDPTTASATDATWPSVSRQQLREEFLPSRTATTSNIDAGLWQWLPFGDRGGDAT